MLHTEHHLVCHVRWALLLFPCLAQISCLLLRSSKNVSAAPLKPLPTSTRWGSVPLTCNKSCWQRKITIIIMKCHNLDNHHEKGYELHYCRQSSPKDGASIFHEPCNASLCDEAWWFHGPLALADHMSELCHCVCICCGSVCHVPLCIHSTWSLACPSDGPDTLFDKASWYGLKTWDSARGTTD